MNINAIRPDEPTIAIEHQATGETPVNVTPEGIQPAEPGSSDKVELKACPFCGSAAEYYGECDMVKVRCSNYNCQCELITWFDEPEEAAEE